MAQSLFLVWILGSQSILSRPRNWETVENLNKVLLTTCKELIEDAKLGCIDMVFKDLCIEILAKAKLVLSGAQFEELSSYVTERLKEKPMSNLKHRERIHV